MRRLGLPPPRRVKKQAQARPDGLEGLGGLLNQLGGGGLLDDVLASMLDMDGDGNPLDDILRLVGKGQR